MYFLYFKEVPMKTYVPIRTAIALMAMLTLATVSLAGGPDLHKESASFDGLSFGPYFGSAVSQISTTYSSTARAVPSPDLDNLNGFGAVGGDINFGHSWGHFYAGVGFTYSKLFGQYTTDQDVASTPIVISFKHLMRLENSLNADIQLGYVFSSGSLLYIAPGYSGVEMYDNFQPVFGVTDAPLTIDEWTYGPSIGLGMKFLLSPHFIFGVTGYHNVYSPSRTKTVSPNTIKMKLKQFNTMNLNFSYLI